MFCPALGIPEDPVSGNAHGLLGAYLAELGLLAPTGTPPAIIDKLHAELVKVIKQPEVNKTLSETLGMDVVALSPEATQKWIVGQIERWGKVVRDNNIRAE